MDIKYMVIITYEMRELKAGPGKVLTNGEVFSAPGGSVFLGVHDKPENWHEITEEEYKRIKTEEERESPENI